MISLIDILATIFLVLTRIGFNHIHLLHFYVKLCTKKIVKHELIFVYFRSISFVYIWQSNIFSLIIFNNFVTGHQVLIYSWSFFFHCSNELKSYTLLVWKAVIDQCVIGLYDIALKVEFKVWLGFFLPQLSF